MSNALRIWLFSLALALTCSIALPASAQATKDPNRRQSAATAAQATRQVSSDRGGDKFPAGPVYFGKDYLGSDPDPFIRLQLMRDLSARYPGNF